MNTITLTLRSRDDGAELIAELVWENGRPRVVHATPAIAVDLERLISVGLVEWVGERGSRERRHTASTDTTFLERLGGYFARQSGFVIKLVERQVIQAVTRKLRPKRAVVRGAVYIVNGTHQPDLIAEGFDRATHLPANAVRSVPAGLSTSRRRAVYRGLFESAKADSHERN